MADCDPKKVRRYLNYYVRLRGVVCVESRMVSVATESLKGEGEGIGRVTLGAMTNPPLGPCWKVTFPGKFFCLRSSFLLRSKGESEQDSYS